MLKVLVLFSDPPGKHDLLRLDKEDRALVALARRFPGSVSLERQHASQLEDIHQLLTSSSFDVIQFSGHGSADGIVLDQCDIAGTGKTVSAERLQSLLAIPEAGPRLVVLLSCYSNSSLPILSKVAPFVITAIGKIDDQCCLEFIAAFYEHLYTGYSIQNSFEHAKHVLNAKALNRDNIRLDRRVLIEEKGSRYVESKPDPMHDSILVNLDCVSSALGTFGLLEEEVLHLIARKLSVHEWIFAVPRENCLIPIGKMLFGEFRWENAHEVVYCTRLMKLRPDISPRHWEVWHKLLIAYNDLASSPYRILADPAAEGNRNSLDKAIKMLQHYIQRYLVPAKKDLSALGLDDWLPYVDFVTNHCEAAEDQYSFERFPLVVKALEEALTNFHELVDGLRPPEQLSAD